MSQKLEEPGQLPIYGQCHLLHLDRVRANLMSENIVSRQADDQQVCSGAISQLFVGDQLPGEFKFVVIGERCRSHELIKAAFAAFRGLGTAQDVPIAVFPIMV